MVPTASACDKHLTVVRCQRQNDISLHVTKPYQQEAPQKNPLSDLIYRIIRYLCT